MYFRPGAEEAVLASLVSSGRAQEVEKHNLKGSEKPEGQFQIQGPHTMSTHPGLLNALAGSHLPRFAHTGSSHSAHPFPKSHHLQEATLIVPGQLSFCLSHLGPGRLVLSQPECLGDQPIPAFPVDGSCSGQWAGPSPEELSVASLETSWPQGTEGIRF